MVAAETYESLLHRIRGEFAEMPGLRLTSAQAARLWHVDMSTATSLLLALVDAKFLYRTAGGAYQLMGSP